MDGLVQGRFGAAASGGACPSLGILVWGFGFVGCGISGLGNRVRGLRFGL